MKRQSIALFLSTLALAGGTVACSKPKSNGEKQSDHQQLQQPSSQSPASTNHSEGGEGGEGGEG